ncbi:hypothetical protein GHT06_020136 [Daphnia sinensis]|uniref:Uncharacterized protein n=1 Tax=Daphnia sinensis TaxID=1820382 RepID=A0AAD5KLS0_9CRUS|nr:hypothetical protein GHT06_020136 [Daphnia sinensis]
MEPRLSTLPSSDSLRLKMHLQEQLRWTLRPRPPHGRHCRYSLTDGRNIAALLEYEPSDFEETDDEIESLSDRDRGNKKENQDEPTTEQESESEIQEKTDADMNPISETDTR